tara:strand:+ start:897 stop:1193 length:297 start_codon:yes stop_codon:yes gene_type:complete
MAVKKKHVPAAEREYKPSDEMWSHADKAGFKKKNSGGKGSRCRSFGKNYEENYDQINWGEKKSRSKKKPKKKATKQEGEPWISASLAGEEPNTTNLIT